MLPWEVKQASNPVKLMALIKMYMYSGSIHKRNRDLLFHTILNKFSWISWEIFKAFYVLVSERKLGISNLINFKNIL